MIMVFRTVRYQEHQAQRWSTNAHEGRMQKKVAAKALLYITNYLIIYGPAIALIFVPGINYNTVGLLQNILLSSQGILNAMVHLGLAEKCCIRFCCYCCPTQLLFGSSRNGSGLLVPASASSSMVKQQQTQTGSVEIPQEAFMAVLKLED